MIAERPEDVLVGAIALAAVPWIVWMLVRGVRDGRLAIGKGRVVRGERPDAFRALFALYVAAGLAMVWIGLDLIFGLAR